MSSAEKNGHKAIDYCFVCKELSSLKCSNCVKVFYCSSQHQRQDWKRHKRECRPFKVNMLSAFCNAIIFSVRVRFCSKWNKIF